MTSLQPTQSIQSIDRIQANIVLIKSLEEMKQRTSKLIRAYDATQKALEEKTNQLTQAEHNFTQLTEEQSAAHKTELENLRKERDELKVQEEESIEKIKNLEAVLAITIGELDSEKKKAKKVDGKARRETALRIEKEKEAKKAEKKASTATTKLAQAKKTIRTLEENQKKKTKVAEEATAASKTKDKEIARLKEELQKGLVEKSIKAIRSVDMSRVTTYAKGAVTTFAKDTLVFADSIFPIPRQLASISYSFYLAQTQPRRNILCMGLPSEKKRDQYLN